MKVASWFFSVLSSQRVRGRRALYGSRAKCYRKLRKAEAALADEKRRSERYRKRLEGRNVKQVPKGTPSPRSRADQLLKAHTSRHTTLAFHFTVLDSIRERYASTKDVRQRRSFASACRRKLIKKYKLQKYAQSQLKLSHRQWYSDRVDKAPQETVNPILQEIHSFLERDDHWSEKYYHALQNQKAKASAPGFANQSSQKVLC